MKTAARICLLTPGHVSSTPRLVKEADALAAAGYDVRVVSVRQFPPVDPLDDDVIRAATWRCERIDATRGLASRLVRRFAKGVVGHVRNPGIRLSTLALDGSSLRIAHAAAAEPADLYLGHCVGTLAAAAAAAARHRTHYGFDLEDFHDGETLSAMADRALVRATRIVQAALLPRTRYLTAASPLIAAQYQTDYGVSAETVLNVFPRSEAPAAPLAAAPISEEAPAVLYWFSQTIGGDRGLEQVLGAMAQMKTPVCLHVRGFVSDGYREQLNRLTTRLKLRSPVRFLAPARARDMVGLSAAAHAGISAEQPLVPNRDICLTNKLFTYMLAGVPTLLSPTRAHAAIAPQLGEAVRVLALGNPAQAASEMDHFLQNPGEQAHARAAAWTLAQSRYCWDIEKDLVLRKVDEAVRPRA